MGCNDPTKIIFSSSISQRHPEVRRLAIASRQAAHLGRRQTTFGPPHRLGLLALGRRLHPGYFFMLRNNTTTRRRGGWKLPTRFGSFFVGPTDLALTLEPAPPNNDVTKTDQCGTGFSRTLDPNICAVQSLIRHLLTAEGSPIDWPVTAYYAPSSRGTSASEMELEQALGECLDGYGSHSLRLGGALGRRQRFRDNVIRKVELPHLLLTEPLPSWLKLSLGRREEEKY